MDKSNANPNNKKNKTSKDQQLEQFTVDNDGTHMTTNQGLKVSEDEFSLKAGERGPTLMEDFHFREKMTHFDHERIPERIVHARGFGAHGYFQVYESMKEYTSAAFLQDPSIQTPVFVRFSTVAGSRGSADTVRDVRGFAAKFYTEEGNYDLVGNNMPVFFIQDAMKFPDFIHAVKPEPHNEIPQAQSAHDTFWDFVVNNTETAHMVMWAMSDRSLPRSFRMMEGFGVHTFRFVNDEGKAHFIKFHWKPVLGVHSLVWDETQKLAGKDPDFNRRDLWDAIESGNYPEYEFGVQMIAEDEEFNFDFDILDPTKVWPEEMIPVKIIGKMTLNRNTDNFFAETEQIAFHPGHVVPGIDFTNDPLLQGRLFSYTDTQLSRLGGPNFHEIPINRSVSPVHNNQRDGIHRMTINKGPVSYHKNGIAGNTPKPVPREQGGYEHYTEKVEGRKVRARSDSFKDHYSQAAMFWNSMSEVEQQHIVAAFQFELGKLERKEIRQQVVDMFANVNSELAKRISDGIGTIPPQSAGSASTESSPALSMMNTIKSTATRKVAVIAANGYTDELPIIIEQLKQADLTVEIVSVKLGMIRGESSGESEVKHALLGADSVLFDAVLIVGGSSSISELKSEPKTVDFIKEAYQHLKPIGAIGEGANLLPAANGEGIVVVKEGGDMKTFAHSFIDAIAAHRHWTRTVS
ncbi:catalase [Paenibacillus sp. JCM 10914]|uniref:catalase n=1 Tax=Paenibacillus sp. JCM 10914 TaxID=1236974 RepID=UPI0003CC6125|nr:catalase [Paenibacillus sp. JCM 10914]GAE08367.1 catalase [Paenibacillus sp. JCM 10914]